MPRCWRSWASALAAAAALAGCGGGGSGSGSGSGSEQPPAADPLRYAVIGDSFSNGEGLTPEQAWPVELADRLGVELVDNAAVSGYTAVDAITVELDDFEAMDPQVATLMIGANDVFDGDPPGLFRRRFRVLLSEMTRIVGDVRRIVVVTIPDFTRKPLGAEADPREIRRFNDVIRAEAERQGAPVADVFEASRRPTDPSPDGLHPSPRELDAWLSAIEPVARAAWR